MDILKEIRRQGIIIERGQFILLGEKEMDDLLTQNQDELYECYDGDGTEICIDAMVIIEVKRKNFLLVV